MKTPDWTPVKLPDSGPFQIELSFEPDDMDPESHFIGQCGWSDEEYDTIKNYNWFSAKVAASFDGKEMGAAWMGGCCHPGKRHVLGSELGGYLPQMVEEAVEGAAEELARLLKLMQAAKLAPAGEGAA